MLLGGLWHGANWTFVLWGFLHGLALIVHRSLARARGAGDAISARPLGNVVAWAATFAWVALCFTIFRCADIETAWHLFTGTADPSSDATLAASGWLALAALGAAHAVVHRRRSALIQLGRRMPDWAFYSAIGAIGAVCASLTPLNPTPFIYFQF
jgi:hypothetical protein